MTEFCTFNREEREYDVQPNTACCQMKLLLQVFLTVLKGQIVRLTLSHANNPRDLTLCSN